MKTFKKLPAKDKKELLKFPAYISMLAANRDDKLDDAEKDAAIKLSHTATFACDPILKEFYREVDKVFEKNIALIDRELPKDKSSREEAIKKELSKLERIVWKLGKEYTDTMHQSMKLFKEHISKAHHNVLIDFIFPLSIPYLNE
ncbi:MAG: hypothetical protein EHM93_19450 [Bacteroidales bacterium]|nr:MAG: hypothetical protein EHM93_19450 [Bacteroidales bacterium]